MQLESLSGASASVSKIWNGPATGQSHIVPIFSASTRKNDMSSKANTEAVQTHFSLNMISVPSIHQAGLIERASFGKDDPKKHFVLASRSELDEDEFKNALAAHVSGRVGRNRDVLLFVHGFNTSAEDARNRLAQIMTDSHFGGVGVMFTWPSEGALLAYESDKERATASRDAVEQTIADLAATPGVGRVHILAHSMGTWLAMEALRQHAISGHPNLDGHLGDVMLAAPDIDLDVFKQQMARLKGARVSVFASANDRALSISSTIAGNRPRLGIIDVHNQAIRDELDNLGVKTYDITQNGTGLIQHDTFAEAPAVVSIIGERLGAASDNMAVTQATLDYAPPIPVDTSSPDR
jgi:esterase/lipase superfamily enzyme